MGVQVKAVSKSSGTAHHWGLKKYLAWRISEHVLSREKHTYKEDWENRRQVASQTLKVFFLVSIHFKTK
jgi:hypothetical protein